MELNKEELAEKATRKLLFKIDPYGDAIDEDKADIVQQFSEIIKIAYREGYFDGCYRVVGAVETATGAVH